MTSAHPDNCDCLYCTTYESASDLMDDIVAIMETQDCPKGTHVWDNITPSACWKCGIPKEANK